MYPLDVILNIVEELEVQEVMRVAQTCRAVHSMVVHSKSVWRRLIGRYALESDSIEPSYSFFRLYYTKRKRWMDESFITNMDNYAVYPLDGTQNNPTDRRIFLSNEYIGLALREEDRFISVSDGTIKSFPRDTSEYCAMLFHDQDWFISSADVLLADRVLTCHGPCGVHYIHSRVIANPLSVVDGMLVVAEDTGLCSYKLEQCASPHDDAIPLEPLHEYPLMRHRVAKIDSRTFGLLTLDPPRSMCKVALLPDGRFERVGDECPVHIQDLIGSDASVLVFGANEHILAARGYGGLHGRRRGEMVQVLSRSGLHMHDYGDRMVRLLSVAGDVVLVGTYSEGSFSLEARTDALELLWTLENVSSAHTFLAQVISKDLLVFTGYHDYMTALINIAVGQVVWELDLWQLCEDVKPVGCGISGIAWRCSMDALVLWTGVYGRKGVVDVVKVLRF